MTEICGFCPYFRHFIFGILLALYLARLIFGCLKLDALLQNVMHEFYCQSKYWR